MDVIAREAGHAAAFAATALEILMAPACNWAHLDAIGGISAAPDASLEATADSRVQGQDAIDGSDSSSDTPLSSDGPRLGERQDFDADDALAAPDAAALDGEMPPLACSDPAAPVRQWNFDLDMEGWTLSGDPNVEATATWAASTGNSAPGALQVDITQFDVSAPHGSWLRFAAPLGSLAHRTVSAWAWLEAGVSPHVKVFVQTGNQYSWGDGGAVTLTPHVWTCVTLTVSEPDYNGPNYDPSSVVVVGFELLGSEPFRVYVDSVRY